MNNKSQKNIIYNYNNIEDLPYQGSNLDKEEIVKNTTNLNNSFQQLLDNDLFIENELNRIENIVIGPKTDDTLSALKNTPDGYKFWGGLDNQSDLSIIHKIDKELEDSITKIHNSESVKFICEYGNTIFIAYQNSLKYTEDGENFIQIGNNLTAYGYYKDDSDVLFATNEGIHVLYSTIDEYGKTNYDVLRINKTEIENISTVELDRKKARIIVGTDTGVYIGEIPKNKNIVDLVDSVVFYRKSLYDRNNNSIEVKVNDIHLVDTSNYEIMATENGIFKPIHEIAFIHKNTLHGGNCKCSIQFDGNLYFGLYDGLYKASNDTIQKIYDSSQILSFSVSGSRLYFNTANNVYYMDVKENISNVLATSTSEEILKIQHVVLDNKNIIFMLTKTSPSTTYILKYINEINTNKIYQMSEIGSKNISDFIVKKGSNNYIFITYGNKLDIYKIDGISEMETNYFNSILEFEGNQYISDNKPGDDDSFLGIMENQDRQIAVASNYIVDINDSSKKYIVPTSYGKIKTYQYIENTSQYRYLLVCQNNAILLGEQLNLISVISVENSILIGGYCGYNFMCLIAKNTTTKNNKIIIYSFPDVIEKIDDSEFIKYGDNDRITHIVEKGNNLYFVMNGNLIHTEKQESYRSIKDDKTSNYFNCSSINITGIDHPVVMTSNGSQVNVGIITDVAKGEDDDDGQTTYELTSDNITISKTGSTINGMFSDGNLIYSMTNKGVIESYIQYEDGHFKKETMEEGEEKEETYFPNKDIRSGTSISISKDKRPETTKIFNDKDGNIYVKYQKRNNNKIVDTSKDIVAFHYIEEDSSDKVTIYADNTRVYIKKNSTETEFSISGVKRILQNDIGIFIQNPSGLSVITGTGSVSQQINHTIVDIFENVFPEKSSSVEMQEHLGKPDYIIASDKKLIKYSYNGTAYVEELLKDFSTEAREIISLSKVSDNSYVINHGGSYTTYDISETEVKTETKNYPNDINGVRITNVKFFCHHTSYVIMQQIGGSNVFYRYFDESGNNISKLDNVTNYYDGDSEFIYSTTDTIKDDSGSTIYIRHETESITGVFEQTKNVDGTKINEYYYQNSTGVQKISYESNAIAISTLATARKVSFSDDVLFYLNSEGLYCRKLLSLDPVINGDAFNKEEINRLDRISDFGTIKDITFSEINSNGNRSIYLLTDTKLIKWEYTITDSTSEQLNNIKKYVNYEEISLGDIKTNTAKFLDVKIMFTIDGIQNDITSGVFNKISDISEKFVNHGIFLYHSEDDTYNGFYEINDKSYSLSPSGKTLANVSSASLLNNNLIIGMNGETNKGVYEVHYDGSDIVKTIYNFDGTKTYTEKVYNLICNNGVTYIKNQSVRSSNWKYFIDGEFETINVLMDGTKVKTDFSTIMGISSKSKTYLLTDKNIYKIEKLFLYKMYLDQKYNNSFTYNSTLRIVDDSILIRLLEKTSSDKKITEYKCQRNGNNFTFSSINTTTMSETPQKYYNILHVDNTAASGIKFVKDERGCHVINNDYEMSDCPMFKIDDTGTISKYGKKYFIGTKTTTYSFDGIENDVSYKQMDGLPSNTSFHKIVPISDEKYLISSSNGLYIYSTKTQSCYKISSSQNYNIPSLSRYRFSTDESYKYIYGRENGDVYISKNYRKWDNLLTINDAIIQDIYVKNSKEYYFGTDKGLYASKYEYTLSNDIPQYNIEKVSQLYQSIYGELTNIVNDAITCHIDEEHGENSFITYVNSNILPISFEKISEFQRKHSSGDIISVNNDLVQEMRTSDTSDGDVMIEVTNFLSSYQENNFTYISKRYISGITELFIYVPTTNTYYIPHVEGSSYCNVNKETEIKRKNLSNFGIDKMKVKSKTEGNYTNLTVYVSSSLYKIDNIMDIQINGNSLPLKIYKDHEYKDSDGDSVLMFHSKIYPSVLRSYDTEIDDEGYYKFNFSCFGSDAQAIRIQFYDSTVIKEEDTYKVHFILNGGSGTFSDQRFIKNVTDKRLKKADGFIYNNGKTFNGWSLSQNPEDNSNPDFIDRSVFPGNVDISRYIKNGVVNLYAVWLNYTFTDSETTLVLNSNNQEFYIDSGDIIEDTKIGNKAVINYDN